MENGCNLTLKTNIAALGFSVKTVLWHRNMPISQRLSNNYENARFRTWKMTLLRNEGFILQ